jgi:cardiolipin synthase
MRLEWTTGNRLEVLENGEQYYPRVFEAIAGARREVLLETFILFDDPVGRQLQQALIQAARNGADVQVLIDGWGSPDLGPDFVQPLTEAGVKLRVFEPAQRWFGTRINLFRRMHRKLVVVDGERAFVGGINYSVDHLAESGPQAKQDWAVQIEGPLVAQIQAFCRASVRTPQPARRAWLARWRARTAARQPAGDAVETQPGEAPRSASPGRAAFVTRDNARHREDIEHQYRVALRGARKRVIIANAYFFPGWRTLKAMRRAARRGVRVDLVLQGEPDMAIVQTAASLLYGHLARAGVHVHEYCARPLHGKVAVVDGRWATVGSSNLDPISLGLNLEANIVVRDEDFARALGDQLERLIRESCREVEIETPGRLGSAWIAVRSAVVFHLLRRFPAWARWLPRQSPKVAMLPPHGA